MNKNRQIIFIIMGICLLITNPVLAQAPRPTPTNTAAGQSDPRGGIFGAVYVDVNGDGVCVNSGVEGEVPVEGVTLQFTSSNGDTTLTLETGADGTYGLVAAGESFWELLVLPQTNTFVTSENPKYVPVYRDGTLFHSDVNFCVASGTNAVIVRNSSPNNPSSAANAVVLVPEAGAPAQQHAQQSTQGFFTMISVGIAFLVLGLGFEWHRRRRID